MTNKYLFGARQHVFVLEKTLLYWHLHIIIIIRLFYINVHNEVMTKDDGE